MPTRRLEVIITGDTRSLERAYDRVNRKSTTLGGRFASLGKTAKLAGGAAGVYALSRGLTSSVNAALEAERAETRLRGAFESAGVSAREYAKAQERISKVSKQAALDDEDLSDALARLTRTTGSVEKGLQGMQLAANIARARGISLASATNIVEKAHVKQFRGLKTVGVQIDKNTTVTQALERAQRKFAGSAERYGSSAAGAQDKLNVAFENLQERVGAKLLPVLQRLALKLVDLIDWSDKNWPRVSKAVKDVAAKVKPIVESIVRTIRGIANVVQGVVRIIVAIKNGDWSQVWTGMKQIAVDGIAAVIREVTLLPRKILAALGAKAWSGLTAVGGAIKNAALSGLKGLADAVVNAVRAAINKIIQLANKSIDLINKIPLAPDIPKIPEIGRQAQEKATSTRVARGARGTLPTIPFPGGSFNPALGTRQESSRPTTVVLKVNQRELGAVVLNSQQRAGKETAASRRGPFAGQRLALG